MKKEELNDWQNFSFFSTKEFPRGKIAYFERIAKCFQLFNVDDKEEKNFFEISIYYYRFSLKRTKNWLMTNTKVI